MGTNIVFTVIIGYFMGGIIMITITAWIFSLFFKVKHTARQLELQTELLIELAKKAGVTETQIATMKRGNS